MRKTLGGGMRQLGVLCAAALVGLQEHVGKLEGDHKKAKTLAGNLLLDPLCLRITFLHLLQLADDSVFLNLEFFRGA